MIHTNYDRMLRDIELTLKRLEQTPQKYVTRSVKKAAGGVLGAVTGAAPVETGALQGGFILVGERHRKKGKKVYQIVPDRGLNSVFQRPVMHPGLYGSPNTKGGHAYYPASMEYGFITRGGGYWPGYGYMKSGADAAGDGFAVMVIEDMWKKIAREWVKKNA